MLKTIPTVVLTTSELEADQATSYQLPGELLPSKPAQWDAFATP